VNVASTDTVKSMTRQAGSAAKLQKLWKLCVGVFGVAVLVLIWTLATPPRATSPVSDSRAANGPSRSQADQADALSVDEKTRQAISPDSGSAPDRPSSGTLIIIAIPSRTPVMSEEWELRARSPNLDHGNEPFVALSGRDGDLVVPAGDWKLVSVSGKYSTIESSVEIRPGETKVCHAQEVGDLTILVTDAANIPIPSARVSWTPRLESDPETDLSGKTPEYEQLTSASGLVVFRSCPARLGRAAVAAAGYERQVRTFVGATESVNRVVLRKSVSGARILKVVSQRNLRPVLRASLRIAGDSSIVASASEGDNALNVPDWVPGIERVEVSAPGYYPQDLKLSGLATETVQLCSQHSLVVVATGDVDGGETEVTIVAVSADHIRSRDPIFLEKRLARLGVETTFELPAELEVTLTATDALGRECVYVIPAHTSPSRVELVMAYHVDSCGLLVVDVESVPIQHAIAVIHADSRRFTVRQDKNGVLHIPDCTGYFEILAEGFVPARGTRNHILGRPRVLGNVAVELHRAAASRLTVVSADGAAVPGVELRLYVRPNNIETPAESEWLIKSRRSFAGITGRDGGVEITGTVLGTAEVTLTLPECVTGINRDASLYYWTHKDAVRLVQGQVATITCDPPRLVTINVVNARTGEFLPDCTIHDEDIGTDVVVHGGVWQGWIRSSTTSLRVSVPDFGEERPQIGAGSNQIEVAVNPRSR